MALLTKIIIPDKSVEYPRSLQEAKELIAETFKAEGNKWGEAEQKVYFSLLGINKEKLEELDRSETRLVFNDLVKSRMILCAV